MQTVPGEFRAQIATRCPRKSFAMATLAAGEGGRVPRSVVDLLCELIAQPSVNPRLAPPGTAEAGENRVTDWLARFAGEQGWAWGLQAIEPSRCNFFALVPGDRGDTLLWEVHQDTVSVQGMTVPPFEAAVRDGRVYGRGACDVKGSMAAMLAALVRAAEPAAGRPNILLACSINEECGFSGARAMAELDPMPRVLVSASAIAFDKNVQGTQAVWHSTGQRVAAFRAGVAERVEFTEEDRAQQQADKARR